MSIRLLFVDDSVTIRKIVELAFKNEDVEVTTVGSARKALKKIKEIHPDVIVTDIGMSEMNGLELCSKVRQSKKFGNTPILLLKNDSDDIDEISIENSGATGYFFKPFKSEELVKKVKELGNINDDILVGIERNKEDNDDTLTEMVNEIISEDSADDASEIINLNIESKSAYEGNSNSEIINLNTNNELSADAAAGSDNLLTEVVSTEDELSEEDTNISGLLTPEDIKKEESDIDLRNKELDEFFGEEEVDWEQCDIFNTKSEEFAVDFFIQEKSEDKKDPTAASDIISSEKLEDALNSVLKRVIADSNEKIVKEQLEKFFKDLAPKIISSIERIVWEIVPDLAESLIKREIERIKNG